MQQELHMYFASSILQIHDIYGKPQRRKHMTISCGYIIEHLKLYLLEFFTNLENN